MPTIVFGFQGTQSPTETDSVSVQPSAASVEEGSNIQLTATAFNSLGEELPGKSFAWVSSNPEFATVNQSGIVSGIAAGNTTITATSEGVSGEAAVGVQPAPPVGPGLIFFDDFESYAVGSRPIGGGANGFNWTGGFFSIVVTDEQSFSGTRSVRFDYPGEPDLCEDSTRELQFELAPDGQTGYDEIWIEYMVRVPDNFEHRSGCGGTNNKLLSMWAENYNNSAGDAEITIEWARATTTRSFLRQAVVTDPQRLADDQPTQQLIKGTIFDSSMRGTWIRLRYHYRIGGSDAVNDPTIVDIWRDNTKICEARPDYNMKAYPPENPPGLNYFRRAYMFGWSNSGFTEDTNFYVDDFKFWVQDPEWTFS